MTHPKHKRSPRTAERGSNEPPQRRLEVVLKADTNGTLEACSAAVAKIRVEGVTIGLIERAVGDVSKTDLSMALTGDHLVLGFDVGALPRVEEFAREHGVEVRLYRVIYHLTRDLEEVARGLVPPREEERLLGQARVIALFKGSRKGIILGCDVLEGRIAQGKHFRVITAAGPVHTGLVESLRIERDPVTEARPGQQVGLKIQDFNKAQIGDLVECFDKAGPARRPWSPRPGVHRVSA